MKPYVTYSTRKTKLQADKTITTVTKNIINGDYSIDNLRRLCGALCYKAVFQIPEYDLVDGKIYTLENICYHVQGILTLSMHDILESFSKICLNDTGITTELCKVLDDCLFIEVIHLLEVNTRDVYGALLLTYLNLTDKTKLSTAVELCKQSNTSVNTLSTYFESEVHQLWKT